MSTTPTISWEQYQQLPPDKRRRPLTAPEYEALSQQQRWQTGLDEEPHGAPVDFTGPVFPNPDHVQPQLDTDSPTPTKLPSEVTTALVADKTTGSPQIDFSQYEDKSSPPGAIDFSKYEEGAAPTKPHSTWQQVKDAIHEVIDSPYYQDIGEGMSQLGKNPIDPIYHAINSAFEGKGSERTLPENVAEGVKGAVVGKTPSETIGKILSIPIGAIAESGEAEAPATTPKGAIDKSAVLSEATKMVSPKAGKIIDALKSGKYADLIPERAQAAGRLYKHLTEGETPPTPEAPPVPEHFGKGQYGTPVDQWGQRIAPETPAPVATEPVPAATAQPAAAPKPDTSPKSVEQKLNDALGGKPLERGVPIGKQKAVTPASADSSAASLPDGFTPVKSSALRGYKYDAAANEFHSITTGGQHYVHGDVSPGEVAAFEEAGSKGKAWQYIRQNPLVAKVVDGQRVAVKPPTAMGSSDALEAKRQNLEDFIQKPGAPKTPKKPAAPAAAEVAEPAEDLSTLLQQSLDQIKNGKSGVTHSMEDPAELSKRWNVDDESLASGREQTRGMTAEQTEEYTQKLAERYKQGFAVEPLMETRDAAGNLIEVDGRQRAIAAQRAGVKKVPVIVRYVKTPATK